MKASQWNERYLASLAKGNTQTQAKWEADGKPVCPHCFSMKPWDWHQRVKDAENTSTSED